MRGLYDQYVEGAKPRDRATIFDDDMLGLIKRDKDAAGGEVGYLDYDPVCACQDWDKLQVTEVRVVRQPKTVAAVTFTNAGQTLRQSFTLACAANGWRVHDIVTLPDNQSLRDGLTTALAEPH